MAMATDREIEAATVALALHSRTGEAPRLARLVLEAAEQCRTEYLRCTVARGHEPTDEEWSQWMTDVRRDKNMDIEDSIDWFVLGPKYRRRVDDQQVEIKRLRAAATSVNDKLSRWLAHQYYNLGQYKVLKEMRDELCDVLKP